MGRFYFDQDIVRNLWRIRYAGDLQVEANSFNDGVIVIDLAQWRKRDVGSDVRWWMQKHREADPALWKFGTQPIFLLLGFGRWQQLPEELYLGDLGFRLAKDFGPQKMEQASLLHFDGEHKP